MQESLPGYLTDQHGYYRLDEYGKWRILDTNDNGDLIACHPKGSLKFQTIIFGIGHKYHLRDNKAKKDSLINL